MGTAINTGGVWPGKEMRRKEDLQLLGRVGEGFSEEVASEVWHMRPDAQGADGRAGEHTPGRGAVQRVSRGVGDSTRLLRLAGTDLEGPVPAQRIQAHFVFRTRVTRRQAVCNWFPGRLPKPTLQPVSKARPLCSLQRQALSEGRRSGVRLLVSGPGGARWKGLRTGGRGPCTLGFRVCCKRKSFFPLRVISPKADTLFLRSKELKLDSEPAELQRTLSLSLQEAPGLLSTAPEAEAAGGEEGHLGVLFPFLHAFLFPPD